ncbi:MAG: hypothetical protein F6K62_03290 [Sphaerospermopsis sp. SIO1G2]|nr:hypothetical protein [Sphaerospermopsis sp. SIO1G1]NET70088.1 hypothetical protein [Sphaerospermopsis sp. SIO1G2]
MIYGDMSMMIFILAAGYLFAVYVLLALAKRTGKHGVIKHGNILINQQHQEERELRNSVTEVANSQ